MPTQSLGVHHRWELGEARSISLNQANRDPNTTGQHLLYLRPHSTAEMKVRVPLFPFNNP
jgi:hypothetical protein